MCDSKKAAALGAMLLLIAGCNAPAGGEAAKLPEGETDLSCGALIFATANLLEDEGVSDKDLGGSALGGITKYGTAYAQSKGITGPEAFDEIKLEAYKLTGKVPGASVVLSPKTVVRRAKACMGS